MEIWRKIRTFSGKYEVSNLGNVRRIGRGPVAKSIGSHGYWQVHLSDRFAKWQRIHRLIADAFIKRIPKGYVINHKDGDKLNNNVSNLEICTYSDNLYHAYRAGQKNAQGENNGQCKLTDEKVKTIRLLYSSGLSCPEIASRLKMHKDWIWKVATKRAWSHVK